MRRFDDRPLWAVWLFGLLVAAWVAQVAGFRPNAVEAGSAVEVPSFEPSRLLDEDYFAMVDDWAESEFALRGAGLRAKAAIDYDLFGDSPAPDLVVVGEDDWLFLAEYLDPSCEEVGEVMPPVAAASHPDSRFVVTAPKAAYHAEALRDPERACLADARAAQRAAFAGQTIDIDGELRALRDAGLDAFIRDDTHWSMDARLAVARVVVESVEPGRWNESAVSTGEVQRLADLARLIGIRRAEPIQGPAVTLSADVVDQQTISLNGDLIVLQTSVAEGDHVIPGVTYLVGDSQMSYVVPLMAPYFEDLRFVNWFLIEAFGFPAGAWPDPDRLIVQTIEHGAAARMADPTVASYLERLDQSAD